MYPYVFVAGPNKHDVLLVSQVPAKHEILTLLTIEGLLTTLTRPTFALISRAGSSNHV